MCIETLKSLTIILHVFSASPDAAAFAAAGGVGCRYWRGCGGRGPGRGGRGLHLRPGAARPEEGGQAAAANKQGGVGIWYGLFCFFLGF